MSRKFVAIVILSLCLAGLVSGTPARALSVAGGYMRPTCTNVAINMTYHVSRDNTGDGTGREHYGYIVTDGNGTVLAQQNYTDAFNGTDNYTLPYAVLPAANPIIAKFRSFAGNGLPDEVYYVTSYDCAGLPSTAKGITSGFELRTITCDVAVFDAPGGTPVSNGAKIIAGQTWYVNTKPVKGADGKSWTEIYVSGDTNGYIPTYCVS
ncbi:MAG: hypothetical protein KF726_20530 [Anaerolineae bacterium]|nr:hypothetical protein [Anaerolineae bacterium]